MDIRHAVEIIFHQKVTGEDPTARFKRTDKGLQDLTKTADKQVKTNKQVGDQAAVTGKKMDTLNSIIGKVGMWAVATGAVYGLLRALKSGVAVITEFDEKITTLRALMDVSKDEMAALGVGAIDIARKFGLAVSEVAGAMELWVRQGKNVSETLHLTNAAALLANVSSISLKDAVSFLTGATRQYNLAAEQAVDVTDKWVALDIKFAAEVNDIAKAFSATGATAYALGVTFDELGGMVATLTEVTRRGGAEIGRALRTIFVRMYRPQTILDLEIVAGLAVKTAAGFRPMMSILAELSARWDKMTDSERHYLAQSIAGLRQVDKFIALMDHFDRVLEGTLISFGAHGEAAARNKIIMESLTKTSGSLSAQIAGLAVKTGDTTRALDLMKLVVSGLNTTMGQWVIIGGAALAAYGALAMIIKTLLPALFGIGAATEIAASGLFLLTGGIGAAIAVLVSFLAIMGIWKRKQEEINAVTQTAIDRDLAGVQARLANLHTASRLIDVYESLGRTAAKSGVSEETRNRILKNQATIFNALVKEYPNLAEGSKLASDAQKRLADMTDDANKAFEKALANKLLEKTNEYQDTVSKSAVKLVKSERDLKEIINVLTWAMVRENLAMQDSAGGKKLSTNATMEALREGRKLTDELLKMAGRAKMSSTDFSTLTNELIDFQTRTKDTHPDVSKMAGVLLGIVKPSEAAQASLEETKGKLTDMRLGAAEATDALTDLEDEVDRNVKSVDTFAVEIYKARMELEKNLSALQKYAGVGLVTANQRVKEAAEAHLGYYKKLLDIRAEIEAQGPSREKLNELYRILVDVLRSSSSELEGVSKQLEKGNLTSKEAAEIYSRLSKVVDTEVRESIVRMNQDIIQATKSIESMGDSFGTFFERILYDLDYAKDASKHFFEMMRQEMVKTIIEASRLRELVFEPLAGLFIPRPPRRPEEMVPEVPGLPPGAIPTTRGAPGMIAGIPVGIETEEAKKAGETIGKQAFLPSLMKNAGNYIGIAGFMAFQMGTASDRFKNQWKSLGLMMGAQIAASYVAKAQIGGVAAFGLPIVGGLVGMLIGGLFDKTEETRDEVQQVTRSTEDVRSGIDVSNKQLEIVNRNLSAIRQELEPWIMPESFYLRERLPEFQGGGTVKGNPFQKFLAILHGQETIFTPKQMGALTEALAGPRVTIGSIQVGNEAQGRDVVQAIQEAFGGHRIRAYQGV